MQFSQQEEIYPIASQYFELEKSKILSLFPNAIVEHVGGSAIPEAITAGDLDIQVRATSNDFQKICDVFKNFYRVNHLELWNQEFALFKRKDHPVIPMSIAVTVIDSSYDEYSKTRDVLKNNPKLLKKYNSLKLTYQNKTNLEYTEAKRKFFGLNGRCNLLN